MSESKDFASLSPKLLARKGGAKPAMRPQVQPLADLRQAVPDQVQEALGWNGSDEASEALGPAADIVPITGKETAKSSTPDVVIRRERLAQDLARAARDSRTRPAKAKPSAFTLRIDADRHAKLRIACMATNQSAQQLLTQALDRMLAEIPETRSMTPKLARPVENRKVKSDG